MRDKDSDDELDCIYQITAQDQDWVNPMTDERISWEHDSPCTLDSNDEIEQWQNRLHEVTTLNRNLMVRSLRRVMTKARELSTYAGATNVEEPIDRCEKARMEQKRQGMRNNCTRVEYTSKD